MADELDIESWLEAPYKADKPVGGDSQDKGKDKELNKGETHESKKEDADSRSRERSSSRRKHRSSSRSPSHHRSSRNRSRSRERRHRRSHRSKSRSKERERRSSRRERSRERHHDSRDKDREREREREKDRDRDREKRRAEREKEREREREMDKERYRERESRRTRSPIKSRSPSPIVDDLDRDHRTVFCIQLAARLTNRDLKDFFSQVGKVRDARIVSDRNSRRSKGVGYVEFYSVSSVEPAIALTGKKLLGVPIIVQASEAEKNRYAEANSLYTTTTSKVVPYHRLYVGNLQLNLTRDDLRLLFEPFGPIDYVELPTDLATGRGKGYAFVQYRKLEDAKSALAQMNGFELGGRPLKVGLVSDKVNTGTHNFDDPDSGVALNSHSRAELMKKLARDEDMGTAKKPLPPPPTVSRCVLLENMFDPETETEQDWEETLEEEVETECNKFGEVRHIYLDSRSKGNIYLKFESISSAQRAIQGLHGRWFGGRQVVAKYFKESDYREKFSRS